MKKIIGFALIGLLTFSCSKKEEVAEETTVLLEEPETTVEEPATDESSSEGISAADIAAGKTLIENSDCYTCHKEKGTLIGPAYDLVAKKYSEKDVDFLIEKIIDGGSGNWGDVAMQPHANLSKEDAKKMVAYILSVK